MNVLNAVIQLRRDNDYNYKKVENSFIPANGEVVLVDTAKDGLRAKVGDGYSTFAQLQYTDADLRNTVLHGYFYQNNFYQDAMHSVLMNGMINKIYIDDAARKLYFFDGTQYITIQDTLVTATAQTPGVVKLYGTTGQNIDGTMTQKAITDELDLRYKTSIDSNNELLVFSF